MASSCGSLLFMVGAAGGFQSDAQWGGTVGPHPWEVAHVVSIHQRLHNLENHLCAALVFGDTVGLGSVSKGRN